jgi:biopolymer transport protein ExbB
MSPLALLFRGDAVHTAVAVTLLGMSMAAWFVIFWKGWLLQRALADVPRSTAAFWQAADVSSALAALPSFDRAHLLLPLVQATQIRGAGTLAAAGDAGQQLTRVVRDALHGVLQRLQSGQVLLATVGSTAPFVGLLGTVWGIYHALGSISGGGQISIDQIAAPVGEALIMTAAGLAVAIPAVLAYNVFSRWVARLEADLEGFAFDLRELLLSSPRGT